MLRVLKRAKCSTSGVRRCAVCGKSIDEGEMYLVCDHGCGRREDVCSRDCVQSENAVKPVDDAQEDERGLVDKPVYKSVEEED